MADLVTALRLREVSAARHDLLELSPERAEGVAGYAAGLEDVERAPATEARHRVEGAKPAYEPGSFHDEVVRTTKDLDAMIADAGVTGTGGAATRVPEGLPSAPDSAEEMAEKQRP
jgi:hypothetical protein